MVWKAEIYSCTAVKDGCPALELLTGDTIDIYEWLEFEFYSLVWFWNNQPYDAKPSFRLWIGVSQRVGSAICYWILSEKVNYLS